MNTFSNIPPEIARILRASVRRIRNIVLFRGIFTVATVAAIFLLVSWAMFAMIDDIADWVRWTFWAVSIGAIAASAWMSLVRPLLRRYSIGIGSIASLLAGAAKEAADELGFFRSAGASSRDAVADALGVLIASLGLSLVKLWSRPDRDSDPTRGISLV